MHTEFKLFLAFGRNRQAGWDNGSRRKSLKLLRAETYYRHQIMLRAPRMRALSQRLAAITQGLVLPEDVTLSVDIDPVNLA